MNALELFRTGKDYIEIAGILNITVPEVERKIHALRSEEKGDTSQEEYRDHLRQREERRIERKIRTIAKVSPVRGAEFLGQVRP